MAEIFFISDTHFGHKNCLAYDNRPFTSIEECDEAMIDRWNSAVGERDHVYHLGDVSWYNAKKTIEILDRLHGIKHLIAGNHDSKILGNLDFCRKFLTIDDYLEINIGNNGIVLCHYPIPCYKNHFYGWYHFFGHVHNSFEHNMIAHFQNEMRDLYDKDSRMYNVGCMMPYMDYTPRTLDQIKSVVLEDEQ